MHLNISKEELDARKGRLQDIATDIEKYMELYGPDLPGSVQVKGAEPILRKMGTYLAEGHGPTCRCPAFAEILVKEGSCPTETLRYGVARDGTVLTVTVDISKHYFGLPQIVSLLRCDEYNVTIRELLVGLHDMISGSLSLSLATQPAARA